MTATKAAFGLIDLDEAAPGAAERGFGLGNEPGRGRVHIRRDLDIHGFGVNAFYQERAGATVIGEHSEAGQGASGHEELYVVVTGGATFTIDGETVEARQGTTLFVRAQSKRSAVATEDSTTVLVVGGRPGEPFVVSSNEAMGDFFYHYRNKEYAEALAEVEKGLETHPGVPVILYNAACMESLLGRTDDALAHLAEALANGPSYKERAMQDDDFAALRDDPRFQQLVA